MRSSRKRIADHPVGTQWRSAGRQSGEDITGFGSLPGAPISSESTDAAERLRRGQTLPHREAVEYSECMRIMDDATYCNEEVLGIHPTPPLVTCDPATPLTWADFTAAAPARSPHAAQTAFNFSTTSYSGRDWIVARFNPANSWVKASARHADDRARNGCASQISQCERSFRNKRPGQTRWWSLGPTTGCDAAASPDTSLRATNAGECSSILGPECDRTAVADSARLLHHEQLHFDLACAVATIGNRALAATPAPDTQAVLSAVRTAANEQTRAYDRESNHGCNASGQASWDSSVGQGLPSVTLQIRPPSRRRGSRRGRR